MGASTIAVITLAFWTVQCRLSFLLLLALLPPPTRIIYRNYKVGGYIGVYKLFVSPLKLGGIQMFGGRGVGVSMREAQIYILKH